MSLPGMMNCTKRSDGKITSFFEQETSDEFVFHRGKEYNRKHEVI